MKKNVIIFEDSSKARFGGGQKVTLQVMSILKGNYNLFLLDCKGESVFKNKAFTNVKDFLDLECYGKIVGGNKSSFSIGLKEIVLFPIFSLKNVAKISSFFNRNRINPRNSIIYATTKKTLLLAYTIRLLMGIEYIYHSHSFDDKNCLFHKILLPALKKSKKIICVSNFVKNNIDLPQSVVIYNPIKTIKALVKDITNKEKIVVATFSTLIKLKGIDYFMKSFSYLKNKNKVEYWIFGDGSEKDYLKQFQNKHVHLKGFVENSEEIMLNDVDIVVFPSIVPEACPMVLLEAFKCGLPVISTNIGGQAEIVKNNEVGLLVDIKNSNQIAEKIDFLIENPDFYKKLSKNAIEYASQFDIEKYKKQILEVFNESFAVR